MTKPFEGSGFMPQAKQGPAIPALGHDWGEWVVVTPATETSEGLEQRTRARCGEVETRAIPATIAYRYVGAEGPSWTRGSGDVLSFTFKRSLADEMTYDHFTGIEVDGQTVPATDASGRANYTAVSGSVVVALQPAYLETLADGDHEITALFDDGSAAATFAVKAAPTKPASTAKTGDALPVVAIVIVAVAAAALVAIIVARRKRNS